MAGRKHSIKIDVWADTKRFTTGMNAATAASATGFGRMKKGLAGLSSAIVSMRAGFAGIAGYVGIAFGRDAINSASKLEQSIGAVRDVYKEYSKEVLRAGENAAKSVGLSKSSYYEMSVLIASQLKNGGMAMEDVTKHTKKLISISADLSAMYGGDVRTAVESVSSALKGERDPIEKYGITLTEAAISAEAAALGFEKVNGQYSTQAKHLATLSLIEKQSADARGKFAKESNTLEGAQQRLSASWENAKAKLGQLLIPAMTTAVQFITGKFVPAFERVIEVLAPIFPVIGRIAGAIGHGFVAAWQAWATAVAWVVERIQGLITWLQPLINIIGAGLSGALEAAKIVLQAFWYAIQYTGQQIGGFLSWLAGAFRTGFSVAAGIANGAWQAISRAASIAWNAIRAVVTGAINAIRAVLGVLGSALGAAGRAFSTLWQAAQNAWNSIVNAVKSGCNAVIKWVKELPGRIKKAFGDAGKILYNIGKKIITGLWDGMKSVFGVIKNGLKNLTSALTSWKGPESVDRVLLYRAGQLIIGGFVDGLESRYAAVRASLAGLTGSIPGMIGTDILTAGGLADVSLSVGWTAHTAPPQTITVNVETLAADARTGQAVADALAEYQRSNGRPVTIR